MPAHGRYLNVTFRTADASPDNGYTFFLVSPSGNLVTTDTTPETVNCRSVARADLYTVHPVPGRWTMDVMLDQTVSGREFTQAVYGRARD